MRRRVHQPAGAAAPVPPQPDLLPIALRSTSPQHGVSDDQLFQHAVERFLSPRPAPEWRECRGGVALAPSPFNGDEAWAALSHGLKATPMEASLASSQHVSPSAPPPVTPSAQERAASSQPWEVERTTLHAQIAALRMNLAESTKTNQALQRDLVEINAARSAEMADREAMQLASPLVSPLNAASASRQRRRAFEIASAQQRRRVELRAFRQTAGRALQASHGARARARWHAHTSMCTCARGARAREAHAREAHVQFGPTRSHLQLPVRA